MARLKQLVPRGRTLRLRGSGGAVPVRSRERIDTWRAWYKTARWQRLRWSVLVRDLFTCRRCGRVGASPEMVADHVTPHRGDEALFWSESNLQALCSHCHSSVKQREERREGST